MNRLKQLYQQEVKGKLQKELQIKNVFAIPTLKKIVVNMGVVDPQDPKARLEVLKNVVEQFMLITGQKPQMTKAKKAIAGFKLRAGDPMGVMVTLRGEQMWEFLDKVIAIALPRVKDFRGVSRTAFDGQGNYSLGLEEQIVFPEINYDKIERIRGLQVALVTSTKDDAHAFRLFELLGMPFEKETK